MKKLQTMGLLALVVTISALAIVPTSYAQSITPTEAQCMTAQGRLTTQIAKVEATKTTQTKAYTAIQTKFSEYVTSAEQNTYDTTAMATAQTALTTKITTYTDAAASYATALLTAKDTKCGTTNTDFVNAVTTARTALTATRTATNDVRTTIREEVIPSLKDYATWLKDNAGSEEAK